MSLIRAGGNSCFNFRQRLFHLRQEVFRLEVRPILLPFEAVGKQRVNNSNAHVALNVVIGSKRDGLFILLSSSRA